MPPSEQRSEEQELNGNDAIAEPKNSQASKDSQTASEFIDSQLQLEADAREVLPYSFESCTYDLGPLRQKVFACLTCNPPPASAAQVYTPAGVCYSCSIACHGEHTLVELFNKRNFVCDCGTKRVPSTSSCTLRVDPSTSRKGVYSQKPGEGNRYNQNYQNRFCGCQEEYDPHQEKGTMFQCLGLGTVETGGCGEDWWHPECVVGLPRGWYKDIQRAEKKPKAEGEDAEGGDDPPNPPGFPEEDDFDNFICYKCVESNPWIKQYSGTPGFLPAVFKKEAVGPEVLTAISNDSRKRKAPGDDEAETDSQKRFKEDNSGPSINTQATSADESTTTTHKHDLLPPAPTGKLSLFLQSDFRDHLCHCPACFPKLIPHPQLREEEDVYEPPLSEDGSEGPAGSGATGSIYDRGEAMLNNVDRVRAIEGVMVYNHLRDKVKEFLKPFAESGQAVGAEDIKAYFEKLRGDEAAIKDASTKPEGDDDQEQNGDNRREESGY